MVFANTGGPITIPPQNFNPGGELGVDSFNPNQVDVNFANPLGANAPVSFQISVPGNNVPTITSATWTYPANNVKLSFVPNGSGEIVTVVASNNTGIPVNDFETTFTDLGGAITNPTLITPRATPASR